MGWITKTKRHAIYLRDDACCAYCGQGVIIGARSGVAGAATLDHVIPRHDGGTNSESNLVTACWSCNSSKRHSDLEEWLNRKGFANVDMIMMTVETQTALNLIPFITQAKENLR